MHAFRRYLAEFIGTFIVVFVAAGAIVADVFLTRTRLADSFGPLGIVAAYGLAVAIAMLAVMPISGAHLNPVISISAYVARRLSLSEAGGYVVAQAAGGIVAAFLLRAIMPKSAFDFASGGVPGLATGLSVLQATAVEVVLTFFLTFTFWAVLVDERGPRAVAPLAVGLAVIAGGLAGSAFTGAAMNPVRWLGPALASTHVSNWLIWTVGPLLGGLLGSLAYETLFLSEIPARPSGPPLDSRDGEEEEEEEEAEEAEEVSQA
jgi:glycerol uptake facilitator protein